MDSLQSLIAAEALQPVDPRVTGFARAIIAPFGDTARAVIFYGSCLREAQLDGLMLDFYLIVSDYDAAYGKSWLARANRLIPPNVFPFAADGLSAKYAVLSEGDFAQLCSLKADNVSVWARFAQPTRLVWLADDRAQDTAIAAIAQAAPTLLSLALPVTPAQNTNDWKILFEEGFARTYKAELRAERSGRSASIVDAQPDYYRDMFDAARADGALDPSGPATSSNRRAVERRWQQLQRRGKWLSVIRLAKASFTFAGGIDYLAWKINRHAGTNIVITPWQRRHPLLAAVTLLPRLIARRAIG